LEVAETVELLVAIARVILVGAADVVLIETLVGVIEPTTGQLRPMTKSLPITFRNQFAASTGPTKLYLGFSINY